MTLLCNIFLIRNLIKSLGEQITLLIPSYKNIEKLLLVKNVPIKTSFRVKH